MDVDDGFGLYPRKGKKKGRREEGEWEGMKG
jgi:hypothetical protein